MRVKDVVQVVSWISLAVWYELQLLHTGKLQREICKPDPWKPSQLIPMAENQNIWKSGCKDKWFQMTSIRLLSHMQPTLKEMITNLQMKDSRKKAARGLVSIRPGSGKAKIMADTLLVFAYNSQHSEEQTQLWACSALISTVRSQTLIRWLFSNFCAMGHYEWNRLWCKKGSFIYRRTSTPNIPLDSFSLSTSEQLTSNKSLQGSEITCLKDLLQQIPPQPTGQINSKTSLTLQSSRSAQEDVPSLTNTFFS